MAKEKKDRKDSSGDSRCLYLRPAFWMQNQFWECDLYSDESKQYFRNWLNRIVKEAKYLPSIDSNLN